MAKKCDQRNFRLEKLRGMPQGLPATMGMLVGVTAAVSLLPPRMSDASTSTWTGTTDNTWSTAANWGGTVPASGNALTFTSTTGSGGLNLNNDLTGPSFSVAGITFSSGAGAYVIGDGTATDLNAGNAFALTGGVTNSSNVLETINAGFSMSSAQTFTTTAGGGGLTLGGSITGSGGSIITNGPGTLTLTGADTLTNGISVNGGTLAVNTGGSISSSAGEIFVGDGTAAGTLTIAGGSVISSYGGGGGRAFVVGGPTNGTFNISSGSLTLSNAASGIVLGDNGGSGTALWTQTGGTVTLSGNSGFYVGNFNASTMNISGGTLSSANSVFTLAERASSSLNLSNSAVVTVLSIATGSPTGTIALGDGVNFNGGTSIATGGTSGILATGAMVGNIALNFNGGTLRATTPSTSFMASNFSVSVQAAGGIIDNNGNAITIASNFAHGGGSTPDGGLIFNGSATTTLTGSDSFNGGTTINTGTLDLKGASLARGTIAITNGGVLEGDSSSNGTINFKIASGTPDSFTNSGSAGNLLLNNLKLVIAGTGVSSGQTYTIETGSYTGSFTSVTYNGNAFSVPVSNVATDATDGYTLDYNSGSITLVAALAPEPSSLGVFFVGALGLLRRRRGMGRE